MGKSSDAIELEKDPSLELDYIITVKNTVSERNSGRNSEYSRRRLSCSMLVGSGKKKISGNFFHCFQIINRIQNS